MAKASIDLDLAKLEAKVENMSEKLNKLDEIEKTLEKINSNLAGFNTEVALSKKDISNLFDKVREAESDIKTLKTKTQWLEVKVVAITSTVTILILFFQQLIQK